MENIEKRIIDKPLHKNAQDLAEEYIKQYADAVVLQSKTMATVECADEVQSFHIEKARKFVLSLNDNNSRVRDGLLLLGSLLLGASIQGIISEFSNEDLQRAGWFVIYFVTGIIGTFLGIWGVFKK